jgi:methionyl aminopeptidase
VAIRIKNASEIEKIHTAGRIVREVLDRLGEMIVAGLTTKELDVEAERLCRERKARCLFKGVPGRGRAGAYPGNVCVSLNEEVVHGIPSPDRVLRDGDIVSIDFGVERDGWCADAARTFEVGDVRPDVHRLVDATRRCLELAIERMRPGRKWSDIARVMQDYVHQNGFTVVEEFVGHGIGREMHEDPKVPNYVSSDLRRNDIFLKPGLVLAVEPMVNLGGKEVRVLEDGWTIVTRDGLPSAHWEHTLAIVDGGVRILTE